jgi:hypothetical protein
LKSILQNTTSFHDKNSYHIRYKRNYLSTIKAIYEKFHREHTQWVITEGIYNEKKDILFNIRCLENCISAIRRMKSDHYLIPKVQKL